MKKISQWRRAEEVKQRMSLNLRHKEKNKKMIENVKKTFIEVNHKMYEQIRERKKQNEDYIRAQRSIVLQSRVDNRVKIQ